MPTDDKVLLQQKCQALIQALNEDNDKQSDEPKTENIKLSEIDIVAKQKILYLQDMEKEKFNPDYRANLINMMNMGFFDFKRNL